MIEIHGSCTRHPPSQLISTTTEMSSPSTMSISFEFQMRYDTTFDSFYIVDGYGGHPRRIYDYPSIFYKLH